MLTHHSPGDHYVDYEYGSLQSDSSVIGSFV